MPASLSGSVNKSLLALEGVSREVIVDLLDHADQFRPVAAREHAGLDTHAGRIVANLFFEDSTRTRFSFCTAAIRLGARYLDLTGAGSSRSKGETLVDTALNVEAMGVDAMVVRSEASGGPALVAEAIQCPVINAGDGMHERD